VPGRINGVKTSRGDVFAGTTIVASGAWASSLVDSIVIRPVRGQILLLSGPPETVKHVILSRDQYLIPRIDGKVLLGSTVEEVGFDNRVTADGATFLLKRLGEFAPGAAKLTLAGSWSGLRPATPDRLPVIGRAPNLAGLVVACGHYRNGILLAPVTGKIVADLVAGRDPGIDLEPFRVGR
jgi:glycine oxidase